MGFIGCFTLIVYALIGVSAALVNIYVKGGFDDVLS